MRATIAVSIGLAALELTHPAWANGSVTQAVTAADGWWIPLHLLIIAGYGALTLLLWRETAGRTPGSLLVLFGVCNSAYLAVDGIVVGMLAQTDPHTADALWNNPLVTLLADATGAIWAAALLLTALELREPARAAANFQRAAAPGMVADSPPPPMSRGTAMTPARVPAVGAVLTWLFFVASAAPFAGAALLSRVAALATGGWVVYQRGSSSVPFALLVFAAVLRQHVGPEAALGLVCIALAFGLTGRSSPAASCPP